MKTNWNQDEIQKYIDDEIQENLTLEYKAAQALDKSDGKKKEITKDVSSMANSSGGIIIYGVKEFDDPNKRHLPEKIDPIEQNIYTKEWLEQVINNIRPRVGNIVIYPIQLNSSQNHVIYLLDIPQSITAHQAMDWRYYKRFNFQAVPMEDYEIRDVMGRSKYPIIEPQFSIEIKTEEYRSLLDNDWRANDWCILTITAKNVGHIFAQYVNGFFKVPVGILADIETERLNLQNREFFYDNGQKYFEYSFNNLIQDIVDTEYG